MVADSYTNTLPGHWRGQALLTVYLCLYSASIPTYIHIIPGTTSLCVHRAAAGKKILTESVGLPDGGKLCKDFKEVWKMTGDVGGYQREDGRHHKQRTSQHHHISAILRQIIQLVVMRECIYINEDHTDNTNT